MSKYRVIAVFAVVCFVANSQVSAGVTEAQKAKEIERQMNADIQKALGDLAEALELKDVEVGQAKSVLNGRLKESLTSRLVALARVQDTLLREKDALVAARKAANAKVAEIEELKNDLSFARWVQAALGSGFVFACISAFFQYRQQKRIDEKHSLEIRELQQRLDSANAS